jgi:peptidyl-prolyl cis-trans isomerase A (cyclophilin A)
VRSPVRVLTLMACVALLAASGGCTNDAETKTPVPPATSTEAPAQSADPVSPPVVETPVSDPEPDKPEEKPKETPVPEAPKNPVVEMTTSMGTITIELFEKEAPLTVANFLKYTDEKFYDGTIFHRIIPTFMIQGGGFEPGMKKKSTHAQIKNEASGGLKNDRGTLAMARTGIVDSATAQFFINVKDNAALDHRDTSQRGFGYCVFGKVIEGMDVVDKIKVVPTRALNVQVRDVPVKDVVIKTVRRVKAE